MENLIYISAHSRIQLVNASALLQGIIKDGDNLEDKEFSRLESFIFEDPVNRRLIDKGIKEANEEVDLERYSQYSLDWYRDAVRYLPSYYKNAESGNAVQPVYSCSTLSKVESGEVTLSEEQVIYLAASLFLAARGGKMTNTDIEQASRAARSIYARLVESK